MSYFKYIVRTSNGQLLNGWIQAENEETACKTLVLRGYNVILLEKYRGVVKAKISRETLMTTLRELATLRQSGMQLDECLESLIETTSDSHLAVALKRMKSDISSGLSLSDSVVSYPISFLTMCRQCSDWVRKMVVFMSPSLVLLNGWNERKK